VGKFSQAPKVKRRGRGDQSPIEPLKYQDLAANFGTSCARTRQLFLDDFRRYVRERIYREAAEPNMSGRNRSILRTHRESLVGQAIFAR
jgi:hypothetical protein